MPKITALRRQQRNRGRVNVFLDGKYAFAVQDVIAGRLRIGQELDAADRTALLARDRTEGGYDRALNYLSYRPRSVREMRDYLVGKEYDEDEIEAILARLERARLIDDEAFATFWVDNREAHRPRGVWALKHELRIKGVADEIIDAATAELDQEAGAMRATERRYHRYACLDKQTFSRRLLGFLQRRGFDYGVCRTVVDRRWKQVQAERENNPD